MQAKQANKVQPIPEGYYSVTPWVISRNTSHLIDFIKQAFNGYDEFLVHNEDGSIGHAEIRIGDSKVMMFDAKQLWPDTPGFLRLYVEDGDAVFNRALEAGAVSVTKMTLLSFGERVGRVCDPLGNIWWIHQRVEEIDYEEMTTRAGQSEFIEAMNYVQNSLNQFLETKKKLTNL